MSTQDQWIWIIGLGGFAQILPRGDKFILKDTLYFQLHNEGKDF